MPEPSPPVTPWLPDDAVFGHCRLGLEDFVHAVRHERRTRRWLRVAFAFGVLLSVAGAYAVSEHRRVLGWSLLCMGMATFASHQLPEMIGRRWFEKLPAKARLVKFTLNATGLIVASDLSSELHRWMALQGFEEAPDSFLIWTSEKLFVILPKRAFEADAVERVRARLAREIGAPPELPGFWLWFAAAALLVVLALGLWNWLSPR